MLLCLQRTLNLLDWQLLKGHEEFIGFVYVNGQSYEVQATLTKIFLATLIWSLWLRQMNLISLRLIILNLLFMVISFIKVVVWDAVVI